MKKHSNGSRREREHILVCLSSSPSNQKIIHTAAKLASTLHAEFTALYVQTPALVNMREEDQKRLQTHMTIARQCGAEIITTHGDDISIQIAEYARLSHVTQIVIGRSGVQRRYFWTKPTLTERLIELLPNLDIYIIPDGNVYTAYQEKKKTFDFPVIPTWKDLAVTAVILSGATLISWVFFQAGFTDANIITVYLLGALLTSILTRGYLCSVLGSVCSVILFNYFWTEPRLTLHAYASGYPITFAIMLFASVLTGTLAGKLKAHAKLSARDAFRTKILFNTNQILQQAQSEEDSWRMTVEQLLKLLNRDIIAYPVKGKKMPKGSYFSAASHTKSEVLSLDEEMQVIEWVCREKKCAGAMTEFFSDSEYLYFPIFAGQHVYGVLAIYVEEKRLDAFENSIVHSILGECALALDNIRNAREKEQAAVLAKNEQLRANLLRAISHDLRTPLTAISGNADVLLNSLDSLDAETSRQMLSDIYDDSKWLTELVENLLAITKIGDGSVQLNYSDQLVDEIITEALRHIDRNRSHHKITVDCGEEWILARMDAKLIIQVIVNLVNNAIKYTPHGTEIHIEAKKEATMAQISVTDDGAGIPDHLKSRVFEMFFTGENKSSDSRRSLGLGLTLCQSIVRAHGGEMILTDNVPHGCHFSFTLPLSTQVTV